MVSRIWIVTAVGIHRLQKVSLQLFPTWSLTMDLITCFWSTSARFVCFYATTYPRILGYLFHIWGKIQTGCSIKNKQCEGVSCSLNVATGWQHTGWSRSLQQIPLINNAGFRRHIQFLHSNSLLQYGWLTDSLFLSSRPSPSLCYIMHTLQGSRWLQFLLSTTNFWFTFDNEGL